ncbi:MAG: hypothetical protein HFI29_14460 [Lachnospiraceae bacterium]|jgi:hypothetical protein|nr:hypothetical protein [Lachnospiraceae bacterium]
MNAIEKNRLSQEAGLQIKALKQIGRWKTFALAVSAAGIAFVYTGFSGTGGNLVCTIAGFFLLFAGTVCAVILNLGLKNGRRNVEKMLHLLEGEASCEV